MAGIEKALFGFLPNGEEVYAYTLRNRKGMSVKILNYGGVIVEQGTPSQVIDSPQEERTRQFLSRYTEN